MTIRDCQSIVNHVWRFYDRITPPKVIDNTKPNTATGGRWTIRLPHRLCCKSVLLHETAHALTFDDDGKHVFDEEPHGPRFMAILCGLYCQHLGGEMTILVERAEYYGIVVDAQADSS